MFKKHFYHGLISGIMAALAAIIYSRIHFFAIEADFSGIINPGTIISFNLIACLIIKYSILFLYQYIQEEKKYNIPSIDFDSFIRGRYYSNICFFPLISQESGIISRTSSSNDFLSCIGLVYSQTSLYP